MPSKKLRAKRTTKPTRRRAKAVKDTKVSKVKKQPLLSAPKTKQKTRLDQKIAWFVLLFFCLQLLAGLGWFHLYSATVLSFRISPVVSATYITTGAPTSISAPDANIELGITPANIEQGIWSIPDTTAAHLASSAQPGQGGNVIVYAHNKQNLFGSLKQLEVGDVVTINTTAKTQHEYQIREILTVSPNDISIAMPTDHEVLTLYTCIGFLDSQRLVVKAYPIKVSSVL